MQAEFTAVPGHRESEQLFWYRRGLGANIPGSV